MAMVKKCQEHYSKLKGGRNMGRRSPTPPTPGSSTQKRKRGKAKHMVDQAKAY